MNEVILRQYQIKCLVTKVSGNAGGYQEKLDAAEKLGIPVFVIGCPVEQESDTFEVVCGQLEMICGQVIKKKSGFHITLAGVGMGHSACITKEVEKAITEADILLGADRMIAGYQLSYPEQQIIKLKPEECLKLQEEGLYTCCIKNPTPEKKILTHGKADEDFIRDKVPMTKEEVREVSICKLKLYDGAVVYDIGSGTGSIAVEIAGLSERIKVYAVEQKAEAVSLIAKNKEKFRMHNIEIVSSKAPEGFEELPRPTHAFIGGSGGKMKDILSVLYQKNPYMRVVINAISMETVIGVPAKNLDTFFTDEETTQKLFFKNRTEDEFAILEGVMGVYDGLGGIFPECKEFQVGSWHLGLMMPDEIEGIKEKLQKISKKIQQTVSLEAVLRIAENAKELEANSVITDVEECVEDRENRPVIAVAKDEAFCFYYEDNLLLLEEYGAKIEYFSPLYDNGLPEGTCGILLGGGYPELNVEKLSQNKNMTQAIRKAVERDMPIVAECGGFMYLHSAIEDKEEKLYNMTEVLYGKCFNTGKFVRFGYIELEGKNGDFLPKGERIRGHEFHYYDSENNGTDCLAIKSVTGKSYPCIIEKENCFVGFPHLYYPSNPGFVKNFVNKAREYMEGKGV